MIDNHYTSNMVVHIIRSVLCNARQAKAVGRNVGTKEHHSENRRTLCESRAVIRARIKDGKGIWVAASLTHANKLMTHTRLGIIVNNSSVVCPSRRMPICPSISEEWPLWKDFFLKVCTKCQIQNVFAQCPNVWNFIDPFRNHEFLSQGNALPSFCSFRTHTESTATWINKF